MKAERHICRMIKINRNRKQTAWWSVDIKNEVQIKKEKWKQYQSDRNNEMYEEYGKRGYG